VIFPLHLLSTRSAQSISRKHPSDLRRDQPLSRAPQPLRDSSALAIDLGEIALPCTPSRYLLFIEWCSVSSSSELRRWRRRGIGRRRIFSAGTPPRSSRSDLIRPLWIQRLILEDTGSDAHFAKETLCFSID
jgi:hypothetical protein